MRTPQEIAREALDGPTSNSALVAFLGALREIAALPESAPVRAPEPVPFALPVTSNGSVRVSGVQVVRWNGNRVELVAWPGGREIVARIDEPYAAAWLRLFGLEKERGK